MKQQSNNIFKSLSSFGKLSMATKMQLIGSALLILSLSLNWYSDIDVFRSGDVYTGLSGPLYFVGLNLLILGVVNIALTLGKSMRFGLLRRLTETSMGKFQMFLGFGAMYLLLLVNSIYFSPQFGLNILSKKSEIGVTLALISAVLICVAGYLAFRKKFEMEELMDEKAEEEVQVPSQQERANANRLADSNEMVVEVPMSNTLQPEAIEVANETVATNARPAAAYSGSLNEKSDYERMKTYDSLKRMMLKDTLTPDQRRREREKSLKENAFSANFGKETSKTSVRSADNAGTSGEKIVTEKKAQMYRMDL